MTRRVAIMPDGLFISRPGNDALDATKLRLVEPRYRMLEQHASGSVTSSARRDRDVFVHTATIRFPQLPYVPIVQFTVNRSNQVIYPNHVVSETKGVRFPNGVTYTDYLFGRVSVTRNAVTYEGQLNSAVPVRFDATIMKARSGL